MTKANNGSGNNEARDEWQTPQKLWDQLNNQYSFTFDCCANEENTKCNSFSSDFKMDLDIISKEDICWMNPPFSKAREMFDCFFINIRKGIAIYRFDNPETKLWQEVIFPKATWIFIPKGRVNYENLEGHGARFPSALIGFNVPYPKGVEGTIFTVKD